MDGFTFDQIFAADPAKTGNVAADASVLIFAPDDAARTPLALRTVDGLPMANPVQTNEHGFGGVFIADIERVAWAGDEFSGFFTSYDGMAAESRLNRAAAQAAAVSSAESSVNAKAAAASAGTAAEYAADSAATEVQAQLSESIDAISAARAAAEAAAALVEAPADEVTAMLVGNEETLTGRALSAAIVDLAVPMAGTTSMEVLKPSTDTRPGVWEWIHDSPTGYLFHLMTGVNNSAPIFGLGIDNGGTGIFINNKKTGKGISIQQNDSITTSNAYGIYGAQFSTKSPLIHIDQMDGAAQAIRIVTSETVNDFREALEIITPGSKGGYISSKTGKIHWRSDIMATAGSKLIARNSGTGDGNAVNVEKDALRLATWNGGAGGYWQKRISQNGQSLIVELADGTIGGPDTVPGVWFKAIEAKQVNGTAGGTRLGFYGAAPISKPALLPADATDLATAIALLNYIKNSVLNPLGLAS